ncbi:hypothetical protein CHLRE_11g468063v5 [Chlamydomonas reinhardtii]|uniref:Uncharacterized protein n=1 Tax=Chlamydomonas reinhardtii TaxID=3055 RepID=A0A2K3D837_CHLRE|nr:uncharacterized protein CHLRE_11g468063v5 [Chlamydomonas reinhardtii]PNW76695.1 hypothetical protein CHLRE_11g468063v5 [Chlamydomonas reinhardtii]
MVLLTFTGDAQAHSCCRTRPAAACPGAKQRQPPGPPASGEAAPLSCPRTSEGAESSTAAPAGAGARRGAGLAQRAQR